MNVPRTTKDLVENKMSNFKEGNTVKSYENDYTTYTVLKVYINKQDNQTYLNVRADKYPRDVFIKQHHTLFYKD